MPTILEPNPGLWPHYHSAVIYWANKESLAVEYRGGITEYFFFKY